MPIYDIFNTKEDSVKKEQMMDEIALGASKEEPMVSLDPDPIAHPQRDRFFSCLAARLFFLLLLIGDLFWACYALTLLLVGTLGSLVTFGKVPYFIKIRNSKWLAVKRAFVCALSLLIALFSPAFGIMVACTYFLMYDKAGIDEVVPASLQDQFKDFLQPNTTD